MEATVDNILKVYERLTPIGIRKQFIDMVTRTRSNHPNEKGFSPNKVLLHVGEIPPKLFYVMVRVFGPEWRNEPAISRTFWRRVSKFRINQTTVPQTNQDMLTHDASGTPVTN